MKKVQLIIAVWICACSAVLTAGQDKKTLDALAAVNEQSRPRLAKRLEEFIAYHRSQEWDKMFKLVDGHNREKYTPESFATMISAFGETEFVPDHATVEQPVGEEYRIHGCVTRKRSGKSFQGGTIAYLQEGDWFFTPYFLSYLNTSPIPCKPQAVGP
jgi:hypothetical protein